MPPNLDHIAEDMQEWKKEGFKDVVQGLYGLIGNALQQVVEHSFQAGWEARDRRHDAAVGRKKKTKQQKGRAGLGEADGRNGTTKLRKEVAPKTRRKER